MAHAFSLSLLVRYPLDNGNHFHFPFLFLISWILLFYLLFSILWHSLFINVYYRWLNRNNSWKCCCGSRITWFILCCSSFSLCSFFRSCNYYLLWNITTLQTCKEQINIGKEFCYLRTNDTTAAMWFPLLRCSWLSHACCLFCLFD